MLRDVSTNGGDAVDTQRDPSLQGPICRPGFSGTVVPRNVISDQVEVSRHHAPAEKSGISNIAALIDLIRVPDNVRPVYWHLGVSQLHLLQISKVARVGRQAIDSDERYACHPVICCHRLDRSGRQHLCSGLMRSKPGRVDGDSQVPITWSRFGKRKEMRSTRILKLQDIHGPWLEYWLGTGDVTCIAQPPVVPQASLTSAQRPRG